MTESNYGLAGNWPNCARYFQKDYDKLLTKFTGSDKIKNNYSQAMQDMFVLTMLDGKENGIYVEVGADQPKIISNTYLLETKFNWSGVSFELDDDKVTTSMKLEKINASVLMLPHTITSLFLRNVIIQSK